MNYTMRSCILEQPETLQQVIDHVPTEVDRILEKLNQPYERIYMVGSGTSLNAAIAARYMMEVCTQAEVQVVTPFDFIHYLPKTRLNQDSLVIGISQTARSTGTIHSVTISRDLGAGTVFVTAEPGKPGAQCAQTILNTWTGPEPVGPKTKGFTSTMAALFYLASGLGSQALDLSMLPKFMTNAILASESILSELVQSFLPAPSIKIISSGPNLAAAKEGGLKVLETVRVPVEVYDVEEYMHGPYHCLENDTYLIFLAAPGAGQARVQNLIEFAQNITPHTLVIANEDLAHGELRGPVVALPGGIPEILTPMGYIIPLQLLANDITLAKGRQPEQSRYPNFHATLGSKFMPQ